MSRELLDVTRLWWSSRCHHRWLRFFTAVLLFPMHFGSNAAHESASGPVNKNYWPTDEFRNALKPSIGEDPDEDRPWHTKDGNTKTNTPLPSVDPVDGESSASNERDGNLAANHDKVDHNEEVVALDTLENVELIVEPSVIEFVEDLHPDERVENHATDCNVVSWSVEDLGASIVQNEGGDKLEDGLADDHLPHGDRDERRVALCGLAVENLFGWWISGKSKRSEGIPMKSLAKAERIWKMAGLHD